MNDKLCNFIRKCVNLKLATNEKEEINYGELIDLIKLKMHMIIGYEYEINIHSYSHTEKETEFLVVYRNKMINHIEHFTLKMTR